MFPIVAIVLALVLAAAAVHGIATGAVMTKFRDVVRAESPKMFWLIVVAYFAIALQLAKMAIFDLLAR